MQVPYLWVVATRMALAECSTDRIFASNQLANHTMHPSIHQALQFLQQNRPADALKTLETLPRDLASDPNTDFLLGIALSMLFRKDEAIEVYQRVIAQQPGNAAAHLNLGADLFSLGRYEASLTSLSLAQKLAPNDPMVALNLGNVYKAQGNSDAALTAYDLALTIDPNYAAAWSNRGDLLCQLGQPDEAILSYEKALTINPAFSDALNNLGLTYIEAKRFDEGIAAINRAIALNPRFAMAYNNLGIALFKTGRQEKGLEAYQRAIDLDPNLPDPYFNLAEALAGMRQYQDAIAFYKKAIERSLTPARYLGSYLHTKMKLCDWSGVNEEVRLLLSKVDDSHCAASPFTLLGIASTAAQQKRCAEAFVKKVYPSKAQTTTAPRPIKQLDHKIRIGYLSSDLYAHATAYLMAELFELHDRARFEIILFNYGNAPADAMRERIKSSADAFYDISDISDPDAAKFISEIGIDILVDLKGHTEGARLGILAHRPAPIQVHYLGYPGTLGAPFIDYLIADHVLIKDEDYEHYSEKIVHLPGSYQVNDRKRHIASLQDERAAHGLPNNGFVFCCFNNSWKITPDIFDVWMRILNQNPESVLWLIEDNALATSNLRAEAQKRGVHPERLIFAPKLPLAAHLSRHRHADLFLDTPFYNAHTTASDALWSGLPVLTLQGTTYASRVGASLLNALDMGDLVAADMNEYESKANAFASNLIKLEETRSKLNAALKTTALFDTPAFTRALESAYETMFQRYSNALPCDHIKLTRR